MRATLLAFLSTAFLSSAHASSVKVATPLRTGCYSDSEPITNLAAGTALTLRSSISGESEPCYKVAVEVDGKKVEGYLPASAIDDLDTFDKARRSAAWPELPRAIESIRAAVERTPAGVTISSRTPTAGKALELIEAGQPGKALELLEAELSKRRDPGLLAVAGMAAWRADDSA